MRVIINFITTVTTKVLVVLRLNAGQGLLIIEVFITHDDATQPVGLLWTSDKLYAETST
jgi:hypothetical protein